MTIDLVEHTALPCEEVLVVLVAVARTGQQLLQDNSLRYPETKDVLLGWG